MPCEMLADTYVEHMRLVSKRLALDPDKVSGMGTAASMENAVVETLSFKELTVTAIVTGGIETNGGRAGDPADYYKPMPKPKYGTINIMLLLDCDMPEGVMARALVTCTEAKTAAIRGAAGGQQILQWYCHRLRHGPDDYHRQQCERAVHGGSRQAL